MKRLSYIIVLLMLISMNSYSRSRCSKCGGSRRMVVISDNMTTYGVNRDKKQCPICGRWFSGEHREPCDACNGTGYSSSVSDRIREERSSRSHEDYTEGMSKLTPEEMARVEALKEMAKGHTELVPCGVCQQTGKCFMCQGVGYRGADFCSACAGTGLCSNCGGQKTQGTRHVDLSPEELENIQRQIAEIVGGAISRESGGSDNSSSSFISNGDDENDSKANFGSPKHKSDKKSGKGMGLLVLLAAVLVFIFRKKIFKK